MFCRLVVLLVVSLGLVVPCQAQRIVRPFPTIDSLLASNPSDPNTNVLVRVGVGGFGTWFYWSTGDTTATNTSVFESTFPGASGRWRVVDIGQNQSTGGTGISNAGTNTFITVNTISDLRQVYGTNFAGIGAVLVRAYNDPDNITDQGGGIFDLSENCNLPDDAGMVIKANDNTTCWIRRLRGEWAGVPCQFFGGTVSQPTIRAAEDYVNSRGAGAVYITPAGEWDVATSLGGFGRYDDVSFIATEGVVIKADSDFVFDLDGRKGVSLQGITITNSANPIRVRNSTNIVISGAELVNATVGIDIDDADNVNVTLLFNNFPGTATPVLSTANLGFTQLDSGSDFRYASDTIKGWFGATNLIESSPSGLTIDFADGTALAPSARFSTQTGLYKDVNGNTTFANAGVAMLRILGTGIRINSSSFEEIGFTSGSTETTTVQNGIYSASGPPEGVQVARTGSIYLQQGATPGMVWIKDTGTGSAGWVQYNSGGASDNWTASGTTNSILAGTGSLYDLVVTNSIVGSGTFDIKGTDGVGEFLELSTANLSPSGDATFILGASNRRYGEIWVNDVYQERTIFYPQLISDTVGTGSPEGVLAADRGSTYRRDDGGASTTLYVKEADDGLNTGWVAYGAGGGGSVAFSDLVWTNNPAGTASFATGIDEAIVRQDSDSPTYPLIIQNLDPDSGDDASVGIMAEMAAETPDVAIFAGHLRFNKLVEWLDADTSTHSSTFTLELNNTGTPDDFLSGGFTAAGLAPHLFLGPVTFGWYAGVGSPEGAVTAEPGSYYLNGSGGASTTLYVKESLSGNTGWVAYGGGGGTVKAQFSVTLGDGVNTITTGAKTWVRIPRNMTVTGWDITADQSSSIVLDVWYDSYANFPPTVADTIAGSEKPTLTTATKNQDVALGTWTDVTLVEGDYAKFSVDSVTSATHVVVSFYGTAP